MPDVQQTFLRLIAQHSMAIEHVCRTFGGSCREDREDLRQEIVLRLWTGCGGFRGESKGVTWVWRVATNTAINWRKQRSREVPTEPLPEYDCAEDVAEREELELLNSLIVRLPVADQRLLRLYLDAWKLGEIAEMMGMSETNVQTRIGRIKDKLKKMVI